ncbi:hypothetical protein KSX_80340 [Ktedonospora formicarum]|uniref:Uncharacterized protein n=1 Tax=Ktedonospora formicarum TaxID=2778364 RepID=A0A8J3MXD6_9CHLR|nr:hypothetical protein KSX_80340 [Ktedonospora formicarum]
MDLVTYLCFKRPLDFLSGGNFSAFGSAEKGSQERLLFFPTPILAAAAFARGFDTSNSQAIVAGYHSVDHSDRGASMLGNFTGFSRINQSVIDDQPTLPIEGAWLLLPFRFHYFG